MGTATIRDVAKQARVSLKTVSRVVNRETSVREETRARVLRAIDQLNYRPDLSARSLRSAKAYAIGLVYDNPNPYYIIAVQQGALAACREMGFGLQIHPCNSKNPKLADELRDLVHRSRLAGMVLAPPMSERVALLRELVAHKIPVVRIISAADDPRDGFPCVYVDDRDAAYAITAYLIQLGHVRIGFLWGGKQHRSSPERYKGYEKALQDYGVPMSDELVLEGDYSFDDGFRGARRLLGLVEPPTAIFGSNDEIAAGVLAAARAAGLHVPYDLSVAGFEDSPFSRHSWPSLTTSRQRTEQIAEHATRLLISRIHGGNVENEGFSPELVVRGSTAPPRPRQ
ncbi:MAG TPA: LacI family DNA-binding transcriptional regulator [Rhodanobacteraceae bacterium]